MVVIASEAKQSHAQGTWTQKADFGGTPRMYAIGFAIGTKGYIGTGWNGAGRNDFWEWDQATNVWTQKSNVPGPARDEAIGFAIGTRGYIGTGEDTTYIGNSDFWEWNGDTNSPSYNVWTKKSDFGGGTIIAGIGFSIGSKGYIGTGQGNSSVNGFWEWDQATNVWKQMADFLGGFRLNAIGFSIGTKGYIGTGQNHMQEFQDFWEWNQTTNIWTQKSDFAGGKRLGATSFSIGTKGYIGLGYPGQSDFWEWDQTTNAWTQLSNFQGASRSFATGFSIGTKGYIGTGDTTGNSTVAKDFWEFDPSGNGVNEIENKISVSVFPNPSSGIISIKSDKEISSIEILNVLGEKVYSSSNNTHLTTYKIDLGKQPKGIYFYRVAVSSAGEVATGKIIIE